MPKISGIIAAVVLLYTNSLKADERFPIHLGHAHLPGEVITFATKVEYKFNGTWTNPGNTKKPIKIAFKAALQGTETINQVSDNGRPIKMTITVARCTKDGAQLLPPGAKVGASTVSGSVQFTVNGASPTADLRRVLASLIGMARPTEPTADQEMGSEQPRKIGENWNVNGDQLAKATLLPYKVTGADFSGQGKLVDVSVVDGRQVETVNVTTQCAFDTRADAQGRAYNNLKMNLDLTVTAPADGKTGSVNRSFKRSSTYTVVAVQESEDVSFSLAVDDTYDDSQK